MMLSRRSLLRIRGMRRQSVGRGLEGSVFGFADEEEAEGGEDCGESDVIADEGEAVGLG